MVELPAGVGIKRNSIKNTSPVVLVGTKPRRAVEYAPHGTEWLCDCNFLTNGPDARSFSNTGCKRSSLQCFWGVLVPWAAIMEVSPGNCSRRKLSV